MTTDRALLLFLVDDVWRLRHPQDPWYSSFIAIMVAWGLASFAGRGSR